MFDDLSARVYVLRRMGGKSDGSSSMDPDKGREVEEEGRGPSWTDMTCSIPRSAIVSMASALKRLNRRERTCARRGCVSKSGDAKCISGLYPGVDFFVCKTVSSRFSCFVVAHLVVGHGHIMLHAELAHVEYFGIKCAYEGQVVWSFLRRGADDEHCRVVFGRPKLE